MTLDARNHGESDHSPSMDYLVMHEDLLGVMDKLKVERPIVLGHSMGGKTGMVTALSAVRPGLCFVIMWFQSESEQA